MALLLILICLGANFRPVAAQSEEKKPMPPIQMPEKDAVIQVAQDLFDAMRESDGEKVLALFVDGAALQSMGEREGKPSMRTTPITDFAEAVGKPHDEVWNEVFWDTEVHIDGRLASMWMKYAFYLGDKFSHCGVDSFQLFKSEKGWKITYLADTRQREGCEVPDELKPGGNGE